MSFLDDIKKTFGFATDQSKNAWDIANLKSGLWIMEKQKQQMFQKLGEIVYEQYKLKKTDSSEVLAHCQLIEETDEEIRKNRSKIGEIFQSAKESKEKSQYDNLICKCGAILDPDEKFCGNCGRSTEKAQGLSEDLKETGYPLFCGKCGTPWREGRRFCSQCGSPLKNQKITNISPDVRRGINPERRKGL